MIMDNKVKQKTVSKTKVERHLEVTVVNGLDINLNCPIEVIGNQITIWINKSEK